MIDAFFGEDIADAKIIEVLGTLLPEFESATAARQHEILKEIGDLSWKAGPRAGAAIPLLLEYIGREADRETEDTFCYALSNCAPLSLMPLIARLGDASDLVRRRACYSLGLSAARVGEDTWGIKPAIFDRLYDSSEDVRNAAAKAIGAFQDSRQPTIARLIEMAGATSESERAAALHALGRIARQDNGDGSREDGTPIGAAKAVIMTGLQDSNAGVRNSACYALEGLGLPDEEHAEIALRLVETDTSTDVQRSAAWQLNRMPQSANLSAKTTRLASILDKRSGVASDICEVLGKIGPPAKAAVPSLMKALDAEDDYLALEAAEALWNIERRADFILPALARLFEENGEKVCDIICVIGPDARPLLSKLLQALAQDDNWDLQWAAADAIGSVATAEPETLDALTQALAHNSGIVRSAGARALAKIGEPAIPVLLSLLETGRDEEKQEWIAEAFAQMGANAIAAIPTLRTKLSSERRGLRMWAAIAVAKISNDVQAIPGLIEVLEDVDQASIWKLACDCIALIGPAANETRDILHVLTGCPDAEIQAAAELAIEAIERQPS